MKCKACGKEFHYCTSCDPIEYCSNGFCSEQCWEGSEEFIRIKSEIFEFYKSLNTEQRKFFARFLAGDFYDYEARIQYEWLKEMEN